MNGVEIDDLLDDLQFGDGLVQEDARRAIERLIPSLQGPMMKPSSELRASLDEMERQWEAYADWMPERMARKKWTKPFDFTQILAARSRVEAYVEELETEITARGKLYGAMCGILHDCCQKYKLGLGGENIAELVTEEVAQLRQENTELRRRLNRLSLMQALQIADLDLGSLTPLSDKPQ